MVFAPNAATVFADGPLAAPHRPDKVEIRRLFAQYEAAIDAFGSGAGSIAKATKALLLADLAHDADVMAWVYDDATVSNNGIYKKSGASGAGSWTLILPLPYSFIVASNAGAGTANAIQATTPVPVSTSAIILLNVTATNTAAPVTVQLNGGMTYTIKTSSGNDIAAGGLIADMLLLGVISGSAFRLISDQASAAIVAAAEDAKEAAENAAALAVAAAAGVSLPPVTANTMLVDNSTGTARESKTFAQVKALLAISEPVATRTALKALDTTKYTYVFLSESGREGAFAWKAGNYSTQVAADTQEGVYVKADTIAASAGCWVRVVSEGQYNITWFGAIAGGTVDCSAALLGAFNTLPAAGGAIFIPAGVFRLASTVSLIGTKPFAIVGVDRFASTLLIDQASGNGLFVQNATLFSICDVGFIGNVDRNTGTFNLHVKDVATANALRGYGRNTTGGLYYFENCNTTQLSDLTGTSNKNGASGDTCLKLKASSGTFNGLVFRIGGANGFGRSPCLSVSGPITSMHFNGCTFAGAGPTWSFNVGAISSTTSNFTINVAGSQSHNRQVGDYIVLRGITPAAYNGVWRVASVPSASQLTITSTINPGSATVLGTVEGPTTCSHITNASGACNESEISGCLFEGLALATYGSVGLFMEARDAYQVGLRAPISGWNLNGNYYDFGATGLMLHGHSESATSMATIHGININGGLFENKYRSIHIENARGIRISDFQGNAYQDAADDNISVSTDIFIRGSAETVTRGIAVNGGYVGMSRFWDNSVSTRSKKAGILLDGTAAQLADLIFKADVVFGKTAAIVDNASKLGAADVYRSNTAERSVTL